MTDKLDIPAFHNDIVAVLARHGLSPLAFGMVLTLRQHAFDQFVSAHPEQHQHPGIWLESEGDSPMWFLQVMRERTREDLWQG
ncbi:MAG: hypothetical protein M3R24_08945 [Chloroflexota bacterium]|nr:hypothetical protein [Chloroflexota bacterium]